MPSPAGRPEISHESSVTIAALGPKYDKISEDKIPAVSEILLDAANAEPPLVAVDLSQTEFFSSSFIEVLFRAWNRIRAKDGGRFALYGLTPYCAEVLEVTNLDKLWEIYPTREATIEAMQPDQQ